MPVPKDQASYENNNNNKAKNNNDGKGSLE